MSLVAALVSLLVPVVAAPGAAGGGPTATLAFSQLNRAYSENGAELTPVVEGPLVLHLSSPQNVVVVESHRLALRRRDDGTYDAHLDVTFAGRGRLVADFEMSGAKQQLEDDLLIPAQTRGFDFRLAIARTPQGYRFTALELPAAVEVDIRSQLAGRFVSLCDGLSLLLPLDCAGIDRRLAKAAVPLPPPGGNYDLPVTELTEAERATFDRFLGGR